LGIHAKLLHHVGHHRHIDSCVLHALITHAHVHHWIERRRLALEPSFVAVVFLSIGIFIAIIVLIILLLLEIWLEFIAVAFLLVLAFFVIKLFLTILFHALHDLHH